MNIEELRTYCLSLKGVSEDIKWETNLTFLVGSKIFTMTSIDAVPTRCSLKVNPEEFEDLLENDNIIQAPYLAKGQWISIQDIELENTNKIKGLIDNSYQLIKAKLTKKEQKEIDEL